MLWLACEVQSLCLVEKESGNFELPAFPGLILKESYWRWPQRELAGNTIDFFVKVLGLSFNDAMRHITGQVTPQRSQGAS